MKPWEPITMHRAQRPGRSFQSRLLWKIPNLTSVVSTFKDSPLKRAYFVLATEYSYVSTNTMKTQNVLLNPKSPLVPWKLITIISFQSLTTTNRIFIPIVLPFLKCHVNWIIQHTVFYVWLLPLSIRLLKFIHTVALSEVHLFLLLRRNLSQRWVKVYVIYLPAEGHLVVPTLGDYEQICLTIHVQVFHFCRHVLSFLKVIRYIYISRYK